MNGSNGWAASTVDIKSDNISEENEAEIPIWALPVFFIRKRVCLKLETLF
jgi:hypothetical protein